MGVAPLTEKDRVTNKHFIFSYISTTNLDETVPCEAQHSQSSPWWQCKTQRGGDDGLWGDVVHSERVYLDLSDELLCGRLDGSFVIDGALNG